jgi:hypothetical protein
VVKGCIVPRGGSVALLAGRRETGLYVVRIRRAVEILHMARRTVGGSAHKLAIDVALRAGDRRMRARQRELGKGVVIERGRIPGAGVVARLAPGRESCLRMRRIVGLVEVRHVTADAGGRRPHELSARVARVAVQRSVRPSECESRELQMVELRAHPVVHRMALLAGSWQIQSDVVDADRLRINKVLLVAGDARRRQTLKLSHGSTLVTGIAVDGGMGAHQWEPVEVLINLLNRNMPAPDRVALLAIRPHLALVDVGVAVGALRTHIRKNGLDVALRTRHTLVHAA